MNPQNRNKIILLAVVGVVALYFVLKPFLVESEFDKKYRENLAKAPQPSAQGGQSDATAPNAAGGGPAVKSQFQKAAVDVDQLIASVKEVSFDYDTERTQVNPMTPLVGSAAHKAINGSPAPGENGGSPQAGIGDSQAVLRTFRITGILWDKHDPMAVVSYPVKGELTSEVVTRGYTFPDTNLRVIDIEQERVILDANGTQVSLQLEER